MPHCYHADIDEWLATGPTTRTKIRTFNVWTTKIKVNTGLHLAAPHARSSRLLTRDQRLTWVKKLLTGDVESLPYRVAGTLLLLYAQPLMKIVALPTAAIVIAPNETRISLGAELVPAPEPFADILREHLQNRLVASPPLLLDAQVALSPLFKNLRVGAIALQLAEGLLDCVVQLGVSVKRCVSDFDDAERLAGHLDSGASLGFVVT